MIFFCFLLSFLGCIPGFQDQKKKTVTYDRTRYGAASLGKETIPSLLVHGALTLDGTTITGPLKVNGAVTTKRASLAHVAINGGATFKETKISQDVKVHGGATFKKTEIEKDVVIHGGLTAEDSTFSSEITIFGGVTLRNSKVHGLLRVSSLAKGWLGSILRAAIREVHLINSSVATIHVAVEQGKTSRVELDGHSIVEGDIVFEGGEGEVVLRGDSQVKGKIIGGKLIKQ